MADVENQQDSSFPVKRKSDLFCQEQDNVASKAQKLNPSSNSAESESKDGEINGTGKIENLNSSTEEKIGAESSSVLSEKAAEKIENGVIGDLGAEEEEQEDGDGEEDEDEEEDDDEEEEEEEEEVDRKGKGISRADKGKGKMIEVEESDDEGDSDDEDDEDDESDFSDDPLAEVDLDNILPSRTRRRSSQPGVFISNEISNRGVNNDEDDDSSDDSDA